MKTESSERLLALIQKPVPKKKVPTAITIASAVGVSRATVYGWMSGKVVPSDEHRVALKKLYGLPIQGWSVKVKGAK